jgi:tetratricopeptide (TPR) repeat protein
VTLGITDAQLAECAEETSAKPDADLDRAYREARNLIEAVARQFEHSNPDSSLAELEDYLRSKAKEWVGLRDRIQHIDDADSHVTSLKLQAIEALDQGQFEVADEALAEAEQSHLTRTVLAEVKKVAELRVARGDVRLMAGSNSEALSHYLSAAEVLVPISEGDAYKLLNDLAYNLYELGRRSLRPNFEVAAGLLERCLALRSVQSDDVVIGKITYRLSLIYRNESQSATKEIKARCNEASIDYARRALSICQSIGTSTDDDLFRYVSTEIALGNALFDRATTTSDDSALAEVIATFQSSRQRLVEYDGFPELMAHVCNSLGSAHLTRAELPQADVTLHVRAAIAALREAITAAEACNDFESWGVANGNLGGALALQARQVEDKGEANFLRVRGISSLLAATETYPVVQFPIPHAQTHLRLAHVLLEHALECERELADIYLIRAIGSYELASEVFDEERYPRKWAMIQGELSRIFFIHAKAAEAEIAESDLVRAEAHMNNALRAYTSIGEPLSIEACRSALEKVAAARKK